MSHPFRLPALALVAVLFALPAAADDARDTRVAAAQRYIAVSMEGMDIAAMVRSMYQPIIDQLTQGGQHLSEAQVAELDALYQANMQEPLRQIMHDQDEVMADLFTLEEIEALTDFYASPVGHSVMMKLPEMLALQQPQIMAMVQGTIPRMMPEIQRIIAR